MPLYDYGCSNCEHTFEKFHSYDNRHKPEKEPCPECNQLSVTFKISPTKVAYFNKGTMKTTDSFNDRLKDIKKALPKENQAIINSVIR